MDPDLSIRNPCTDKKEFCRNCNSHFMMVRPAIKTVAVSKRFIRDLKDREKARSLIRNILDCAQLEFHELHKFEKRINGTLIFRAKKARTHIVYGVDKEMRIIFLRTLNNFTEYKKFLRNRKEIQRMIAQTPAVD